MIKLKELLNEANVIQKIDKLAKANKYGTVDGTRMNGKTAREIMAIFRHPKMNSYRNQMLGMKSHELADLTVTLVKPLKIKVESVNEGRIDITVYSTRKEFTRDGMPTQAMVRREKDGRYYAEIGNRYDKYFKNKRELDKWLKKGGYELAGYDKMYI